MSTTSGSSDDGKEPSETDLSNQVKSMSVQSEPEISTVQSSPVISPGVNKSPAAVDPSITNSNVHAVKNLAASAPGSPASRASSSSAGRAGRLRGPSLRGAFNLTPQPVGSPAPFVEEKTSFIHNGQTYELNAAFMERLDFIGQGVHGTVEKFRHRPSGVVMAVKQIPVLLNSDSEHNTLREVDVSMRAANCPNVVHFYGALHKDGSIWMCIELMDISLENFYKKVYACNRTIPEDVLGVVAFSVLNALHYLHTELKVIHRDVKPSNILVNRNGQVKICDFGISGRLVNSVAKSQVGAQLYMAPERVVPEQGKGFDVRSDVWSFGISMIEVATGKFPYGRWHTLFDQIKQVVNEEPPKVPPGLYSDGFSDLINRCLQKQVDKRPKYAELIKVPFVARYADSSFNIAPFVAEILDLDVPVDSTSKCS